MMQGPTHSRSISDKQFETARLLHDYTVRDAEEANRAVFEYYETRKMLEYVDSILAPIVGQFE
jgi:hypothetical protein